MGMLDIFGRGREKEQAPATLPTTGAAGAATALVQRLLDVGIDGLGQFDSASSVAQKALSRRGNVEGAVDQIVSDHVRLAAAGGFVTGLGGLVTMPVALPANVVGFYILATRMAAAVAAARGYDLTQEGVRSAVLLSLVGADADDLLKKAGYASGGGRLASLAGERLPGPVLMAVNKGVGFRLLSQFGRKTFGRLGRGLPLAGGVIGAGMDGYMIHSIAKHVREEFPAKTGL